MKKVYLDCGGYRGQTLDAFRKAYEDADEYEIHIFEPNTFISRKFFDGVVFHDVAVWTENCTNKMYVNRKKKNASGSSMFKGITSGKLRKDKPITVKCIDFCEWIRANFTEQDYIVLKMNIEGAEYPILKKMIKDGTIWHINVLYVSFHRKEIKLDKKVHDKLVKQLKGIAGLKVIERARTHDLTGSEL
ncbi:unnamed protein product [marine sediment metagenome]|uniref:Methyltransferase FkbM domain-containing protein n=1 Tax=marine sediment metagenome TaxID=412755 RepID=X0V047_9ZZZZ